MVASSGQQAVENGHNVGSYDTGMCQKFVRDQCWRVPSLYGSAIDAWNGAKYKHPGDRNPPQGAPMYFRGGNYGHAVCGDHHNAQGIRSTDCFSAYDVSDTNIAWIEQHWGYTYLGWTEDINGVHVITGDDADNGGQQEDDMPKHVSGGSSDMKLTGEWQLIDWENVSGDTKDVIKDGDPGFNLGGGPYVATVKATVTGENDGGVVLTRSLEGNFEGPDDDWQVDQYHNPSETPLSGKTTYHEGTTVQGMPAGNRLRFQVKGPKGLTFDPSVHILFW